MPALGHSAYIQYEVGGNCWSKEHNDYLQLDCIIICFVYTDWIVNGNFGVV